MENELNLDETIRKLILQIRDFPRAGINFTDITPILERDPVVFRAVIDRMCGPHRAEPPEVIVCSTRWASSLDRRWRINWTAG
jgi:adenine/guanine phosphoribosyltransferase-like PRPP-binding protein